MRGSLAVTAASLALLGACTQKPEIVDRERVIGAIQKAEETQAAALGRKDLDGAVAVFVEDATLYMQGMPPAVGHDAIKAVNERVLKDPALNIAIDEASREVVGLRKWRPRHDDLYLGLDSHRCGQRQAGDRAVGQPDHLGKTGRRVVEKRVGP